MADAVYHTMRARLRLERDGVNVHDREFSEPDVEHDEEMYARITVQPAQASPVEIDLGGVGTASSLFLQTNHDILVGVNSNTMMYPILAGGAVMLTGAFTQLFVQNQATTTLSTVDIVVSD